MTTWTTQAETVDDILDDIWDTRDLISLVEKLADEMMTTEDVDRHAELVMELARATALVDLLEVSPDFQYGETVIDVDYFEQYAQDLADDIGAVDSNAGWPNSFIDWAAAADALKIDYLEVSFEGRDWLVRA